MTTHVVTASRDAEFRAEWWDFVRNHAEPWHHAVLIELYDRWTEYNAAYYGGTLCPPYVLLTVPSSTKAYADTSPVSSFGGRCQIRIRPSIVTGEHKDIAAGPAYVEGRRRFLVDVLLHETVHQWQEEGTGCQEPNYHGHGPGFRDKANQIGAVLGLLRVRTCKNRGPDKHLPSCAQWPINVRPEGYYLGAYLPADDTGTEPEDDTESPPAVTVPCPHCQGTCSYCQGTGRLPSAMQSLDGDLSHD